MAITPIERVLCTAKAHTLGGREGGASRTPEARLNVKVSVPGTPGTGTNPEQLFAVGYLLQAHLNVNLPRIEPEVAQKLVDGAHQECPYSKSTRGNINVVINLKTEPAARRLSLRDGRGKNGRSEAG